MTTSDYHQRLKNYYRTYEIFQVTTLSCANSMRWEQRRINTGYNDDDRLSIFDVGSTMTLVWSRKKSLLEGSRRHRNNVFFIHIKRGRKCRAWLVSRMSRKIGYVIICQIMLRLAFKIKSDATLLFGEKGTHQLYQILTRHGFEVHLHVQDLSNQRFNYIELSPLLWAP